MIGSLAVVVVGRNEGARLVRSLASVGALRGRTVYVDSGSTDGSLEVARAFGVPVVSLDTTRPFTAARARNAGVAEVTRRWPLARFVHLLDADCELAPGWCEAATAFLEARPDVAAVTGRLRERDPEASPYNRLADMEWADLPPGDTHTCGGIATWRMAPLRSLGGFDPTLIAGEEIELCLRVRRLGKRIVRLDRAMAYHDMDMHRLSQWWQRRMRSGHAYAELAWRQGGSVEPRWVRRAGSILVWGGVVPAAGVVGAVPTLGLSLVPWLGYPVLWARSYGDRRRRGDPARHAALYATACIGGKVADFAGMWRFVWNRWVRHAPTRLMEHKASPAAARARGPR